MSTAAAETCATCYGSGEVVTDQGPLVCRDCMGHGKLAGRLELFEWRLRELERGHLGSAHGCEDDIRWLAAEVRRSRDALLQILARCQDAAEGDSAGRRGSPPGERLPRTLRAGGRQAEALKHQGAPHARAVTHQELVGMRTPPGVWKRASVPRSSSMMGGRFSSPSAPASRTISPAGPMAS